MFLSAHRPLLVSIPTRAPRRRLSTPSSDAFQLLPDVGRLDPGPSLDPKALTPPDAGAAILKPLRAFRARAEAAAHSPPASPRDSGAGAALLSQLDQARDQARSISHWFPYDPVRVVNAVS